MSPQVSVDRSKELFTLHLIENLCARKFTLCPRDYLCASTANCIIRGVIAYNAISYASPGTRAFVYAIITADGGVWRNKLLVLVWLTLHLFTMVDNFASKLIQ